MMPNNEESTKQRILRYIDMHKNRYGYAPNQSTIAKRLKMSRQRVKFNFNEMEDDLKKWPEYRRYSYNSKQKVSPNVQNPTVD